MAFEDINFPAYRKYKNGKSYFKIVSRNEFEEIQVIGSRKMTHHVIATQLPEMNHIYDLVYNAEIADQISREEFEYVKSN